MNRLVKVFLVFAMIFSIVNVATAADSVTVSPAFKSLKESYLVGERVKFTVETSSNGTLVNEGKFAFIVGGGEITSVKTVKTKTNTYVTTGSFTPKTAGNHMLAFSISFKDGTGKIIDGSTVASFHVLDPNKLNLDVTPNKSVVKVGDEVPLLITYTSKSTVKFEYSHPVTELYTKKVNGTYKKVVLFTPTEDQTYELTIKATQSKSKEEDSKTVIIETE